MVVVSVSKINIYATIKNAFLINGNATVTTTVETTATSMYMLVVKVYRLDIWVLNAVLIPDLIIKYFEIIVRR